MLNRGSEGGRRGFISHSHIQSYVVIPGKPSARLNSGLKLVTGQRSLRFSILKETPVAPLKSETERFSGKWHYIFGLG
jgi:hypothetical protein